MCLIIESVSKVSDVARGPFFVNGKLLPYVNLKLHIYIYVYQKLDPGNGLDLNSLWYLQQWSRAIAVYHHSFTTALSEILIEIQPIVNLTFVLNLTPFRIV